MRGTITLSEAGTKTYDAVIIPGGGLNGDAPHPWVVARLDAALKLAGQTRYFVTLSRGTTHRPPPLDGRSFPILESAASSQYLLEHGVSADKILQDGWSLDTIGNAYFALRMHCEPLLLRKCIVITSRFHMERTRAIFDWVFGMSSGFELDYCVTDDVGMSAQVAEARMVKEEESLKTLRQNTIVKVDTLAKLAEFLFVKHGAYRAGSAKEEPKESVKNSY